MERASLKALSLYIAGFQTPNFPHFLNLLPNRYRKHLFWWRRVTPVTPVLIPLCETRTGC